MKKAILISALLIVAIPIINSIVFGIGSIFHEQYKSTTTFQQFLNYRQSIIIMSVILIITIPIIEILFIKKMIGKMMMALFYAVISIIIGALTYDQFLSRPYEHGLTFLSIVAVLIGRVIVIKKMSKNRC